ncbi:acetylglutamate kinase [Neomegalonema sp.]|uniref:acetylglutamate kinase n=1 Tax=Neomegalonema sp. TaxID=2039713 RepID=UPI0026307EA3|nr:acetylglutamate kinase [Neomegalonema sp.]MDD2869526.1 acetylglutamate kinase [Neomegalonema sp.]
MPQTPASASERPPASRRELMIAARTLAEGLPYLQRYAGRVVVVKFGGHAMGDAKAMADFARDMALMKLAGVHPVVVHGGGPQINEMLKRLNIQTETVAGMRVTDAATVEVVEMVLAGKINKEIAAAISAAGAKSVGLAGKDNRLIVAEKMFQKARDPESNIERVLDIGLVGNPVEVNPEILQVLIGAGFIPVVAPVGVGREGETYNVNADLAAGAIAAAMNAERLFLLTDVPGVKGADGELLANLTREETEDLIARGVISGGMIPKVRTALNALDLGVKAVAILDGRTPHAALLELFTPTGGGTLIRKV